MLRNIVILIAACGFLVLTILIYTMQPLIGVRTHHNATKGDPVRLQELVTKLIAFGPRDARHPEILQKVEDWLEKELQAAGGHVSRQPYKVHGQTHHNIIAHFGPQTGSRIVIGAHFDAFRGLPGADDNGSGVGVLLELARLLGEKAPSVPVELVAWNLEEPPHFRTEEMGSRIHAKSLKASDAAVQYVVSLEMLGTFTEEPNTQSYPLPGMTLLYPNRGNFMALVGNYGTGWLVRQSKARMQASTSLPIWSINAPAWLVGIDFSDHASYWDEGYPAMMLTDTAFYRNPRYHTEEDTPEKLNYESLAEVVLAVRALIP